MASSILMMLGGAITNAFAFSGSSYLFSHIGSKNNLEDLKKALYLTLEKIIENLKPSNTTMKKRID